MSNYNETEQVFRPVKCTEDKLNSLETRNGYLYFTTDTKKVFLGSDNKKIQMCESKGFYYGKKAINEFGRRGNVWDIFPCKSKKERLHPAPFPEQLANDHIISWSDEGDIVLDPFMGSGTTAKMAILNKRNYIGFEVSKEYCEIAEERLKEII